MVRCRGAESVCLSSYRIPIPPLFALEAMKWKIIRKNSKFQASALASLSIPANIIKTIVMSKQHESSEIISTSRLSRLSEMLRIRILRTQRENDV